MHGSGVSEALSKLDVLPDVMTVKKVFGDAYEVNGVTVVPVAAIRGGGGGGGGEDERQNGLRGLGAGAGFGVVARPVGVFVIEGQAVTWQPAVDVTRIVLGGQLVALAALWVFRRVFSVRSRRS
jgi:uncharacterized spore protein YtfJ